MAKYNGIEKTQQQKTQVQIITDNLGVCKLTGSYDTKVS
jgi:hypothetical protein